MKMRSMKFVVLGLVAFGATVVSAAEVSPQLGGGSGGVAVNMKHVGIGYHPGADLQYGTADDQMHIDIDEIVSPGPPHLRPLNPGDTFTAGPWQAPLTGKAYNHQYGWTPGTGLTDLFLHFGGAGVNGDIWVELIDSTPGLENYQTMMMPGSGTYDPILGTAGSSTKWDWRHDMTHNAYAVLNPTLSEYEATYRVYVADTAGDALPQYADAEVTLKFTADPVPEPMSLALFVVGLAAIPRRR